MVKDIVVLATSLICWKHFYNFVLSFSIIVYIIFSIGVRLMRICCPIVIPKVLVFCWGNAQRSEF
jgi:hypothetical protein